MLTQTTSNQRHRRGRRRPAAAALAAAVTALSGAVLLTPTASAQSGPAPSCAGGTCTVTFTETGAPVTWNLPGGVSSAAVTLYGADGGAYSSLAGGEGAEVTATVALSGVAALTVNVGGTGGTVGIGHGTGGYGGGGQGGGGAGDFGGGGGGATMVSDAGETLLVAGGGGGSGEGHTVSGGAGGKADTAGGAGQPLDTPASDLGGGGGGGAGTQAAGGRGGAGGESTSLSCTVTRSHMGVAGTAGQGGGGLNAAGGGGGGGYFGGGQGGGDGVDDCGDYAGFGGGGGGSSYTGGAGVSGTTVNDSPAAPAGLDGNGEAVLSYANPVATGPASYTATAGQTLTVPASSGLLSAAAGTTQEGGLTVSVTSAATAQGGTVTLDADGDGGFGYAPPAGFAGADSFTYTITDAAGDYAAGTATVTVQPIAQQITFTSTPPDPALVGGTYTPAATGGGSGNPVTFGIDPTSTAGACSIGSGVVSFAAAGTCTVDANQAAGNGYTAAAQVQQVITVDQTPAFTVDSPPATATAAQVYSYTFVASGTPAPSYGLAAGAPSWLSVDSATGTVSGTVPSGTRSFSYSVTASNAAGTATAGPFTVTVGRASVWADLAAKLFCPASLKVGGTGTCTLTVTNNGPGTAKTVTATVELPASLAETSCSAGCARHANVVTWSLSSLAADASVRETVTVRATAGGWALALGAAASASPDPDPFNNISLVTVIVRT